MVQPSSNLSVEERTSEVVDHAQARTMKRRWVGPIRSSLPTLVLVGLLIVVWELFTVVTHQPAFILPPLHSIVVTAVTQAGDKLIPAALVTLKEILAGFAIGWLGGFALGACMFHFPVLRRALLPLVIASQAVPVLAIAPILIIWFGFGILPKVLVVALISFFPVVINTMAGFRAVDRETVELMKSLGAGEWQIFTKVRMWAALPFIFAGTKNAAVIAVIGAIAGEWVGAFNGLGPVMIQANASFDTKLVFAAIFYLAGISVVLFLTVTLIERWLIPWHFLGRLEKQR